MATHRNSGSSGGNRAGWDDRHHVLGGAVQGAKPLPNPSAFKALHGGPIRPRVDTAAPKSMAAPVSKHKHGRPSSRSAGSKRQPGSAAPGPVAHRAVAGQGGGGGGPEPGSTVRLDAVEADLEACRQGIESVQRLAQRHQAAVALRNAKAPATAAAKADGPRAEDKGSKAAGAGGGRGLKDEPPPRRSAGGGGHKATPDQDPAEDLLAADRPGPPEHPLGGDGLSLDIASIQQDARQEEEAHPHYASYKLSESGTIHIDNFEIRRSGIVRTPAQQTTADARGAGDGAPPPPSLLLPVSVFPKCSTRTRHLFTRGQCT